jgi:hypothetical protein
MPINDQTALPLTAPFGMVEIQVMTHDLFLRAFQAQGLEESHGRFAQRRTRALRKPGLKVGFRVVLLAGGRGSRMASEFPGLPKGVLPACRLPSGWEHRTQGTPSLAS